MNKYQIAGVVAVGMWVLLFLSEHDQHMACIKSGGTVALGWFQDGCAQREGGK